MNRSIRVLNDAAVLSKESTNYYAGTFIEPSEHPDEKTIAIIDTCDKNTHINPSTDCTPELIILAVGFAFDTDYHDSSIATQESIENTKPVYKTLPSCEIYGDVGHWYMNGGTNRAGEIFDRGVYPSDMVVEWTVDYHLDTDNPKRFTRTYDFQDIAPQGFNFASFGVGASLSRPSIGKGVASVKGRSDIYPSNDFDLKYRLDPVTPQDAEVLDFFGPETPSIMEGTGHVRAKRDFGVTSGYSHVDNWSRCVWVRRESHRPWFDCSEGLPPMGIQFSVHQSPGRPRSVESGTFQSFESPPPVRDVGEILNNCMLTPDGSGWITSWGRECDRL